jgi:hypothetical protein
LGGPYLRGMGRRQRLSVRFSANNFAEQAGVLAEVLSQPSSS